jgi:hypothetical protein
MIELKVFWLQPATNATLQTTDAQTATPSFYAGAFPDRVPNDVDLCLNGKTNVAHMLRIIMGAPVCIFDFGPGGATRRGVDAAIDAAPTFDNAMI